MFYEQVEGAPMGSPVSPIVANLFLEHLEREALWSAPNPPRHWLMYVDDTFVIQQQANKQLFLDHINSRDPAIQFMVKGNQDNGAIPFLDTFITPQAEHSLSIIVYHQPTHTDQNLQWDSNHNLSAKYSVIGTLTHRAKTICTTPELLNEELEHLREALEKCKYPGWAINKIQQKLLNNNWEDNGNSNNNLQEETTQTLTVTHTEAINNNNNKPSAGHIVVPYVQGLGESHKKICSRCGVYTHFKGSTTIKQRQVRPKDKDPKDHQSNVVYSYECKELDCNEEYIRETSRTLGERYKKHLKEPSPIHVHSTQTGHNTSSDNFNILGRGDQGLTRLIKESIYIRVNNPTLNRNIGKFN